MSKKEKIDKKNECNNENFGLGLGITATVLAAVGTYFLYGSKQAEKNRKKVKSWMLKAKAEVLEELESVREITQYDYEDLVNAAVMAYTNSQNATKKDIKEFKDEMKSNWEVIEKHAKKIPSKTKSASSKAKKSAKDTATKVKKSAKKATKTASKTVKKAVADTKKTTKKKSK